MTVTIEMNSSLLECGRGVKIRLALAGFQRSGAGVLTITALMARSEDQKQADPLEYRHRVCVAGCWTEGKGYFYAKINVM